MSALKLTYEKSRLKNSRFQFHVNVERCWRVITDSRADQVGDVKAICGSPHQRIEQAFFGKEIKGNKWHPLGAMKVGQPNGPSAYKDEIRTVSWTRMLTVPSGVSRQVSFRPDPIRIEFLFFRRSVCDRSSRTWFLSDYHARPGQSAAGPQF